MAEPACRLIAWEISGPIRSSVSEIKSDTALGTAIRCITGRTSSVSVPMEGYQQLTIGINNRRLGLPHCGVDEALELDVELPGQQGVQTVGTVVQVPADSPRGIAEKVDVSHRGYRQVKSIDCERTHAEEESPALTSVPRPEQRAQDSQASEDRHKKCYSGPTRSERNTREVRDHL